MYHRAAANSAILAAASRCILRINIVARAAYIGAVRAGVTSWRGKHLYRGIWLSRRKIAGIAAQHQSAARYLAAASARACTIKRTYLARIINISGATQRWLAPWL